MRKKLLVLLMILCVVLLTACAGKKTVEKGKPMGEKPSVAEPIPKETEKAPEQEKKEDSQQTAEPKKTDPNHTHDYKTEVVKPTCTAAGYTLHKCSCGDSYRTDEVAALGHDYQTSTVEATTSEQGYTLHKCSRCGNSYKDNYTEKQLKDYWTLEDGLSPYDPRVKEFAYNYDYEQAVQIANDYIVSRGLPLASSVRDESSYDRRSLSVEGTQIYLNGGQRWLNDQGKQLVDEAVNYIESELSGGVDFYEFRCTGGYVPFGFYGLTVYYQFK